MKPVEPVSIDICALDHAKICGPVGDDDSSRCCCHLATNSLWMCIKIKIDGKCYLKQFLVKYCPFCGAESQ